MAKNKNAMIRYQVLDRCFRNPGRIYFIENLLDEINRSLLNLEPESTGIKERQLYEDLRFMESESGWSAPIGRYKLGRKKYFRYEDIHFSINNQALNQNEIHQLKASLQILNRISSQPHHEWIHEIILKLETRLGMINQEKAIIAVSWNEYLKGIKFLDPLFNAILNEQCLDVDYQDFNKESQYSFNFSPAYLKQYNNRWFVIGNNANTDKANWILALDRIIELRNSTYSYINTTIDWEDYFDEMIGVTRLDGIISEEIILRFNPETAPYVLTKPLHSSQKSRQHANYLEVSIRVIPNYELESQILSYGELVEVIQPDWLIKKMSSRISLMVQKYRT